MKLALVALTLGLTAPCVAAGQSLNRGCQASDKARALCDAEATLTAALRRNDVVRLARLYADEFQLINFRGRRVDKAGVLSALESGALRFDSLATSELDVRVYGDAGVVTGVQHQVAREPGGDDQAHPKDVRFTHLYVLREGSWRLVASQITAVLSATPRQ